MVRAGDRQLVSEFDESVGKGIDAVGESFSTAISVETG
jgi:hypothetical protein